MLHRTCDGCGKSQDGRSNYKPMVAGFSFKWHDFVLAGKVSVAKVNKGFGGPSDLDICQDCAEELKSALYKRFNDLNPNRLLIREEG